MVAMPPRVGGSSKALPAPPSQPALLPIPTSGAPFYSHRSLLFSDHAGPAPASGLCASWASAQVLPGPCRPRTHLAGSLGPSSLCSHVTHGLEETIPPHPKLLHPVSVSCSTFLLGTSLCILLVYYFVCCRHRNVISTMKGLFSLFGSQVIPQCPEQSQHTAGSP